MRRTALLLPGLLLWTACSTSTEPPTTYLAEFYVRYLVPEQQIKAEATFMAGDTAATVRPLAIEGGVRFNGKIMGRRHVAGKLIRYNYESLGPPLDSIVFEWRHPFRGHALRVRRPMPVIDSFRLSAKETGWQVTLTPPLQADEQLVVMMLDSLQRATTLKASGPAQAHLVLQAARVPAHGLPKQYYFVRRRLRVEQLGDCRSTTILEIYSDMKQLPPAGIR